MDQEEIIDKKEVPLSKFRISFIGGVHIGARALLDFYLISFSYIAPLS